LFAAEIHEKFKENLFAPISFHLDNCSDEDTVSRLLPGPLFRRICQNYPQFSQAQGAHNQTHS
jgi:hypothetical protein